MVAGLIYEIFSYIYICKSSVRVHVTKLILNDWPDFGVFFSIPEDREWFN